MELEEARQMCEAMLHEFELSLDEWRFEFDDAVRRFGCCSHARQVISLSRRLVELNDRSQVHDTMLHEIAHALAGPNVAHGPLWQKVATMIGCSATRCYGEEVVTPEPLWLGTCPGCGRTLKREALFAEMRARACGRCCREKNGGKFAEEFLFVWEKTR